MDFHKTWLVLESGGCQIDEKNKTLEINWYIEKNGGFFADLLLKLEEMGSCPLLSIGLYLAIKDMGITWVLSPQALVMVWVCP
jgi:hypothetical protein